MQRSKINLLKSKRDDPELVAVAEVLSTASRMIPDLKVYNSALWNVIRDKIQEHRDAYNKRGASDAAKALVEKRQQHHAELVEAGKNYSKNYPNAKITQIATHLIANGKTKLKPRQVQGILSEGGVRRKNSGK